LVSEHASYPGIGLHTVDGLAQTGPFFEERKLAVWLQEMAMRLGHAAVILLADNEGEDWPLLQTRGHYLSRLHD